VNRRRRRASDGRSVALLVLGQLEDRGAFLQPALQSAADRAGLDGRERGLALELVMGVERWRLRLDHALAPHVKRGLAQTDPVTRRVLRMATYQLLFLDRIPTRAAVHTAVELARYFVGEGTSGFVNGVLRSLTRSDIAWPEGDGAEAISVRTSQPVWLVDRWLADGGVEHATAMGIAHNSPAPLTIRVAGGAPDRATLADRLEDEGAQVRPGRFAPDALHLEGHPNPFTSASFRDGWWQAQDEASQLVVRLLDPQPGERVWDACAAPGGKTRYIARLMDETGASVATDTHREKANRLGRALRDRTSVTVVHHDAGAGAPEDDAFDRVLIDAPCTGLGVMRRHPEITWRRTADDIGVRAVEQARILTAAADAVKPGGVLVYSVCSDTAEEGVRQIESFLTAHPHFTLEAPTDTRVGWGAVTDARGWMRVDPHAHGADGFFAARLRRAEDR